MTVVLIRKRVRSGLEITPEQQVFSSHLKVNYDFKLCFECVHNVVNSDLGCLPDIGNKAQRHTLKAGCYDDVFTIGWRRYTNGVVISENEDTAYSRPV